MLAHAHSVLTARRSIRFRLRELVRSSRAEIDSPVLRPRTFECRDDPALRATRALEARAWSRARVACVCVLALLAQVLFWSCAPASRVDAAFEPVALSDTRSLDPEVLELTRRKCDEARRAPANARAHGSLGLAYAANGLWDAAERSFDHAACLEPANALWRYHRALALREAGRAEEAFAMLEQAARELPREPALHQRIGQWQLERGDAPAARASYGRALASLEPDHPELLVGLASVDLAEERWADAAEKCRRALAKDAGLKLAHHELGRALSALGRVEEAQRELEAGLGAQPRSLRDPLTEELRSYKVNYVNQIAEANRLMGEGKHAEALPIVTRVVAKRPDDLNALNNLATCLQETGDARRALAVLERAQTLDPKDCGVQLNLSDAHLRLGELDAAQRAAERAVELSPELGRAHLARGRALLARGKLDEAYTALSRSLKLEPRNWVALIAISELCLRRKRIDEARGWLARLGEVDPGNVPARANHALLLMQAGSVDEAARHVSELARLAPGDPRVLALQEELRKLGR